jgi:hypothetical protein
MRKFIRTTLVVLAIGCALAPPAMAGDINCSEMITNVIVHTNGLVYFSSSLTCQVVWCQLPGTGDTLSKGYAMLLAAQARGIPVGFGWSTIPDCSTQNVQFAMPDWLGTAGQ